MKLFLVVLLLMLQFKITCVTAENVRLSLTPIQLLYKETEGITVRLEISGKGNFPVEYLPTNNGELYLNLFQVLIDGKPVKYFGRLAKYIPSVVNITNETLSFDIDLSKFYDFSISGTYQITFNIENFESNSIEIFVFGRSFPISLTPSVLNQCSTLDQIAINAAKAEALIYVKEALVYLNGAIGVRYVTWFGQFSTTRLTTVKTSYANQKLNLEKLNGVDFDCSFLDCSQNVFAYVYPYDSNHIIHLCQLFWRAGNTGKDSRAGTIVHELSHFNNIGKTNDYAYGHTSAQALAISHPANAIFNADSQEYFAENTPNIEPKTKSPTKFPSLTLNPTCRPRRGISRKKCNQLNKKCAKLGFPMKWNGHRCIVF